MEKTNRTRIVSIGILLILMLAVLLGVVYSVGINDPTQTAYADTAVAQVGDTTYTTLNAACSAVASGGTVKLLCDHTESGVYILRKDITLDLNGHIFTLGAGFVVVDGVLTLDNSVPATGGIKGKPGTSGVSTVIFRHCRTTMSYDESSNDNESFNYMLTKTKLYKIADGFLMEALVEDANGFLTIVRLEHEEALHTHNYSDEWSKDENTHWHACTADGDCDAPKADEAAHTYADATDTTDYYTCTVCGYVDNDRKVTYDAAQQGGGQEQAPVAYLDEKGKAQSCTNYTVVTADNTAWTTGWYVVNEDVTINGTVSLGEKNVTAQVHLILCDGATLNIESGGGFAAIYREDGEGTTFTIYGQSKGTGKLNARSGNYNSGICIYKGEITINGGVVNAVGGMGITAGNVTINGGVVTTTGEWGGVIGNATINSGVVTITGGEDEAVYGTVKNAIAGTGWTDAEGTEGESAIAVSTEGQYLSSYKKVVIDGHEPITHEHSFAYTASGAVITATCSGEGDCDVTEGLTLTLAAPTGSMVYTGNPFVATIAAGYSTEAFPNATIKYYKGETEVASCVDAGTYTAKVTFGSATAQVPFTIEPEPAKHEHNNITFTAWKSANSLPTSAGSYYLTADVTLTASWTVPAGTSNLCLNGHVISAASNVYISVITVGSGATLNLYDCDTTTRYYYIDASTYVQNRATAHNKMYGIGAIAADGPTNSGYVDSAKKGTFTGGYITGGTGQGLTFKNKNISGGGFQIQGGGTLNMYGGCIFGNYTSAIGDKGNEGGGVYVYETGVFNMNGGYIVGNQGGNAGGGVENHGTFTMNGGYIGHNTAADGGWAYGGGVNNAGTMTMNGGVIEGNEAGNSWPIGSTGGGINNDGSLTINGGSVINNCAKEFGGGIYVSSKGSLTIGGGVKITGNYNVETKKADNVYLDTDKKITLASALNENNSVGVTLKSGARIFTSGWSTRMNGKDPTDYFVSDVEGYTAAPDGDEVTLVAVSDSFKALDPASEPEIELPEGKDEAEGGDTLTVDTDANPITVKWYYDDNGDGTPDGDPIGEGKSYTVRDPEDKGHKIIAVITQDEDENGDIIPETDRTRKVTDPVKVAGKLPGEEDEKWKVEDPEAPSVKVEIVGADDVKPELVENIKVEVTVKAEVETQTSENNYQEITKTYVDAAKEEIAFVYEVKLIQKIINPVTGEETMKEIQPSDIKEGATIKVTMDIPEALRGKAFKLLHIHTANDVEYINNYVISEDGKTVEVEINRLSEFAFVADKEITAEESCHGFCIGWIVFIFVMLELLYFALYFILWFPKAAFIVEKCKLGALEPKRCLLGKIGSGVACAIFIFALVALCVHQCAASIVSFILALLLLAGFLAIFFIEHKDLVKGWIHKLLKKETNTAPEKKEEETVISATPIEAGESTNVGFYHITKDEDGKCTFTLYYEEGDKLSKEMGVFESEKAAYLAIKHLREKAEGAKAENRVRSAGETIPAPKFVLDVNEKGEYRYSFLGEEGTVLMQSVSYLNEKRCLEDLKKTLNAVGAEKIVVENGELKEDVIDAVEKTPVAEAVEEVAATEIVEEDIEEPVEEVQEEIAESEEDAEEKTEEPVGVSLKENIAVAMATTSHSAINKKYVADYLKAKYDAGVELNCRANETKTGLPLADTHYAVTEDGKKCFVYVYEVGSTTMLLVKVDDEYGNALAEKHPIVKRSAFPKSMSPWYSVIVDDSFTAEEIEKLLDDAYLMNGGAKAKDEGLSLKESLAMAKATTVTIHRSKKGIADYLAEEYGDKAELNLRVNKTKTGLPLADTHYAVREDSKTCFVYVYETDGTVVLLLRLTEEYAKTAEEAGHKIIRSAFPKSKNAWFTVILDDTFTEDDIQELLDGAYDQAK